MLRKIISLEIDTSNKILHDVNKFQKFIATMPSIQNFIIPMKPSFNSYTHNDYIENELSHSMENYVISTITNIYNGLNLYGPTFQTQQIYNLIPVIPLGRFLNPDDINGFLQNCKYQIPFNMECTMHSVVIVGGPYGSNPISTVQFDAFFNTQILQYHGIDKIYFGGYPEGNLNDNTSIKDKHSLQALNNKIMLAVQSGINDINIITQLCLDANAINTFCHKLSNNILINSILIGIPFCRKKDILKYCKRCKVDGLSMSIAETIYIDANDTEFFDAINLMNGINLESSKVTGFHIYDFGQHIHLPQSMNTAL